MSIPIITAEAQENQNPLLKNWTGNYGGVPAFKAEVLDGRVVFVVAFRCGFELLALYTAKALLKRRLLNNALHA